MRVRFAILCAALVAPLCAADEPKKSAQKVPDGWTDLMKPDVWKKYDPKWIVTDEVKLNAEKNTRLSATAKDGGAIWVNADTGRLPDHVTKEEFGDCEVHVEFLIAKNSNSGVKFHAVYEIQNPFT